METNEKGLKILVFTNDTASRKWRFDGIASRFHKETRNEMFITSWKGWNKDTLGADIVILEMLTSLEMVNECHNQGAKVIFEADDAYIDSYGRERKNLQHIEGAWRDEAIATIKACDAVTTTNYYLAEHFRAFTNKPVYILPNFVDYEWYGRDPLKVERATDEIRIGWFGSKGHYEDLRMVVDALKEVIDRNPKTKLVYMGYGGMSSEKASTEVGWGEDVFKEIPRSRREFYRPVEPEFWAMKHRLLSLDIGLAPLVDDFFNHCKSGIKWMEYAITRVPAVLSPVVYGEHPEKPGLSMVEHGKTGYFANTKGQWVYYIEKLIHSEGLRKRIADAAFLEVEKNWNLDTHWKQWDSVYREVAGFEKTE